MNIEEKWHMHIKNDSIIQDVESNLPVDVNDTDGQERRQVMNAALEWAQRAHPDDVILALSPMPRGGADSEVLIRELEKREDFRAYQEWWFTTRNKNSLSMDLYMDWLEALRLLLERIEKS